MTRPHLGAALWSALLLAPDPPRTETKPLPEVRVVRLTILWSEEAPVAYPESFGDPWPPAEGGIMPNARTVTQADPLETWPPAAVQRTAWSGDPCLRWLAGGASVTEDLIALTGSRCAQPAGPTAPAASIAQGLAATPFPPVEIPIGRRLRSRERVSTIIHGTRVGELPGPLRDQAWAMMRDPMSRGQAMFHGSFILPGIPSDQIRSVIALGPGLVKERRAGRDGGVLGLVRVEQAEAGRLLVGLGPFSLSIPSPLRFGAAGRPPRSRTQVDVTRSRWPVDTSTAVTVAGYLSDDTVITFRVTRKGSGLRPGEVLTYPSVHLGTLTAPDIKGDGTPEIRAASPEP